MCAYAIVEAVNGTIGFDTATKITNDLAAHFASIGYTFVIRYLPICQVPNPNDLDKTEVQAILSSGLSLMAVQHVRTPGWIPNGAMGTEDGKNAVYNANNAGLIAGVTIWLDLEGINNSTSHQSVIDYCKYWYNEVKSANYLPGLYVGDGCILDPDELYDLPFTRYWKSISDVPIVATRGYCMTQSLYSYPVFGISIDRDIVNRDNLSGLPTMMVDNSSVITNSIKNTISNVETEINDIISQLKLVNSKLSELT